MHVVLHGPSSGFQDIRNSYADTQNQDSTTERLLDSNDAMDSAVGSQHAFAAQLAPTISQATCNVLALLPLLPLAIYPRVLVAISPSAKMAKPSYKPQSLGAALASS